MGVTTNYYGGNLYRLNDWLGQTGFANNYLDSADGKNYESISKYAGPYTDKNAINPLQDAEGIINSTNPSDTISIETIDAEEYIRINTRTEGDRDLFLVFSAGDGNDVTYSGATLSTVYQITQWGLRNSTHTLSNIDFTGSTVLADLAYTADTQFTGENTSVILATRNADGTYTTIQTLNPAERISCPGADGTYYITTEHNDTGKVAEDGTTLLNTTTYDYNYTMLNIVTAENQPEINYVKETLSNGTSVFGKDILQSYLRTLSITERTATEDIVYDPIVNSVPVSKITIKFENSSNNRVTIPGYSINKNNELVSQNGSTIDLGIVMANIKSDGGVTLEVEFDNGETKNILIGASSDRVSDNTRYIGNIFNNLNPFELLTKKSLRAGGINYNEKIDMNDPDSVEANTGSAKSQYDYANGFNIKTGIINNIGSNAPSIISNNYDINGFVDVFGINRKIGQKSNFIYGGRLYGGTSNLGAIGFAGLKQDNKYVPGYLGLAGGYNWKHKSEVDSSIANVTQTTGHFKGSLKLNPLRYLAKMNDTFLCVDYSYLSEKHHVAFKDSYSSLYKDFSTAADITQIIDIYAQSTNIEISNNNNHLLDFKLGGRLYKGDTWKQNELLASVNYRNTALSLPFNVNLKYEGAILSGNSHKGTVGAEIIPWNNDNHEVEISGEGYYQQTKLTTPNSLSSADQGFSTSSNRDAGFKLKVTYRFN